MATSSLQMISECQRRGLLSKEAAADLLQHRDRLIKRAMKKHSSNFFRSFRRLGHAGEAAEETGKVGKSFLDKLRVGGATPLAVRDGVEATGPAWSDVAANLGKMMALAGLTAGATAGIGGLVRHSKDRKLKHEIDISYRKMFEEHPDLKDLDHDQPGLIRRHFGVLARYAPSLAADPTVAGSWVSATAQLGSVNLADIKTLAETQRRIDDAREDRGAMKIAPIGVSNLATKAMMMR